MLSTSRPACSEGERWRPTRRIEPLRVVDDARRGLLLGSFGEETEHRKRHEERARRLSGAEPERDAERVALRIGQSSPNSRSGEQSCAAPQSRAPSPFDARSPDTWKSSPDSTTYSSSAVLPTPGSPCTTRTATAARGIQNPLEHRALALPPEQPPRLRSDDHLGSMPAGHGLRISGIRSTGFDSHHPSMSTTDTSSLPDYAPVPRSALGPALNEQGYYVGRVERNLYWITDGTYQSAFLTTSDGVVLLDAPPTIGRNTSGPSTRSRRQRRQQQGHSSHLSHHHADHAGASFLFDKNVTRIGHEDTRRLLLRDDDPASPPTRRPQDRWTLEIGVCGSTWPGTAPNHSPDKVVVSPARPRRADADRHRQPGLGAGSTSRT